MKKIIAILISSLMLIVIVSCGNEITAYKDSVYTLECGFVDESKYIELKNTKYSNDSYKTTISGVIKNGDSELEIKNQEIELTQEFGNLWYTIITFDDGTKINFYFHRLGEDRKQETKNIKLNGEKDIITAVMYKKYTHVNFIRVNSDLYLI